MGTVSFASGGSWLARLDWDLVRRLVGRRTLAIALASQAAYRRPPIRVDTGVLAVLGEDASRGWHGSDGIDVHLRMAAVGTTLIGECSRCSHAFGPCPHVTTLAIDLACSRELRDALLSGASTAEAAARAPALREALNLEVHFDGALEAWLAPAAEGLRVEIAASPFADVDPYVGRAYGDRPDPAASRVLSVIVRPAGDRKLLHARDIAPPSRFSARDRRVLEHVRDRGSGRKAAYALGVDASLAIEAMRTHAGVFALGFKGLLDFRSSTVRPVVHLSHADGSDSRAPFDALSASWIADDGTARISFAESAFFPGPFPYVWTREGAIHRVSGDVDLDFARQLALAPVLRVPAGKLRDAGARLLRATRGRGVAMPASEAFGLPAVETPRIVLRLTGEPLEVEGLLVARYRARELTLFEPTQGDAADGPLAEEGRDLECEARARAHAARAGLGLQPPPGAPGEGETSDRIVLSGEDAVAFWQTGLLALRSATDPCVEVELSERLAQVRVGAPVSARIHVTLEGDWLGTRLDFNSSEVAVELDAIRAALTRKERWVALSDGTLTRISSSIEALAEEASEVLDGAKGRLPAHQLGRLDRWLEENDGQIDASVERLRRRLRALAVAAEPEMPKRLRATLRPYQRLGLAWLQFLHALGAGGILADDMGLGKTITTLAFLLRRKQSEGAAPSLVVCPTSVANNWVTEAARFTPDLRVHLLHGPSRDLRSVKKCDLAITTYALLRRDLEALSAFRFRCVILDEAQNIKNADSATTRAARKLDATMRLALTGTPIENRLHELWSLASFVNPGILGTSRAFETRFERPIATDRQSPLVAELRAVVRPFLLRRTKQDVLRELPAKTEIDRAVVLSDPQKRMYDALAHALRASVARDIEKRAGQSSLSVFTALTRLRQMACDPRLVDAKLPAASSAKREAFLDLVHELVAENRRALVFSQFVELLTLWRRDLDSEKIAYEYLDGGTRKRDEVVARFQEGSAPLFLLSLKAGGAGLNLTAADTVIHCDPWWNPAVEDQATDRAYRIGQDKPVTVVRLIARGTIEEKMLSLKSKKRELTKVVIGDDARALQGISEEDIRLLLGDSEADDERAPPPSPAEKLATASHVLSPDFGSLVEEAKRWLVTTGRMESELASVVGLPVPYAARLARGLPFPCSRAVADRIRGRLRF